MPFLLSILAILALLGILQVVLGGNSSYVKIIWALFILLVPVAGLVIYCLCGIDYRNPVARKRLHGKAVERLKKEITPEQAQTWFSDKDLEKVPEEYRPLAQLLLSCGEGNKVYAGNSFEIITSGLRKRELILEDIRRAKRFIHLEYFRFGDDKAGREVRDLLYQKVAEGVEVCFLNNNMIGRFIPRSYFRDMRRHGMNVVPYTHIRMGFRQWLMRINCQNHRKIMVIDGQVAYVGGMNLNDHYFYQWRDTHLRVTGPLIARLEASFMDSWIGSGGTFRHPLNEYLSNAYPQEGAPLKDKLLQEIVSAPEYPWRTSQLAFEWIVNNARRYLYIQTPYWVPPDSLLDAVKSAAMRGVDVQLMLPKEVDTPFLSPANHSFYAECLQAGIRIFERGGEFIHAKTLVADDGLTVIGGSNLDCRSFDINSENDTIIYDEETAQVNKQIFLKEKAFCEELDLATWLASRSVWQRFSSAVMRLFRPLL
ncbi:MAG: cardiolipin synthase [Bacteroidales bacterium]|nr:cardiolipin synthase [Bacteroidales bacterium]